MGRLFLHFFMVYYSSNHRKGLYHGLDSALGLYCDRVRATDLEAIRGQLRDNYAISRDPINQPFSSTKSIMVINLYSDYSESIADAYGLTAKSGQVNNRNAIVAFVPDGEALGLMSIYKLPLIERCLMEVPMIRGGVPPFEGGCAYFEIAPWNYKDKAAEVLKKITEFETPRHQEVLEQILQGSLGVYNDYALYQHLEQTKQTPGW